MTSVLVVDDERPALEDLGRLLETSPSVDDVVLAGGGAEALRLLAERQFDVVFMDVRMPDLDGLELGKALMRFADPPALVFVSAFEDGAVSAFEHQLHPLDYLMKPVSRGRVEEALGRVSASDPVGGIWSRPPTQPGHADADDEIIPVEHQRGGSTRLIDRSTVLYVQAEGDYVRLHTDSGRFLVRAALSEIERALGPARVRARAPQLRREPQARRRDPAAARRRGHDRDGRRQPGAGRAAPGRRPAPEAADVSPSPPARPSPSRRLLPRRGLRSPREELAEATAHGHVYLRGLQRAQLSLSLLALVAFGAIFGVLPMALYLLPRVDRARAARRAARVVDRGRADAAGLRRDRLALRAPRGRARRRFPRAGRALIVALFAVGAVTLGTLGLGTWGMRFARTTSDLLVASRAVTPWWNAAAISGEYLSAASFLGIAGLEMQIGASALWQSLGFTAGYLALLLFVAAPLRRYGSYTIPDFAEARLHSPGLRLLAAAIVLVIGGFYLVPQLKGAGLALNVVVGVALLGRGRGRRRDRRGQRRGRRHARHHLRAGLPVLGEGLRDRGAGDRAADPLRRAAGARRAVRALAAARGARGVHRQAAVAAARAVPRGRAASSCTAAACTSRPEGG